MSNPEYRIHEKVSKGTFLIEKLIITEKIEKPTLLDRLMLFLSGEKNETTQEWLPLNIMGNYDITYYSREFKSFDEANEQLKRIKKFGYDKYYEI